MPPVEKHRRKLSYGCNKEENFQVAIAQNPAPQEKYIACKQKLLNGKTVSRFSSFFASNGVKMSRKINIALVPSIVIVLVRENSHHSYVC